MLIACEENKPNRYKYSSQQKAMLLTKSFMTAAYTNAASS